MTITATSGSLTQTFTETANPGSPALLSASSGAGQSAAIGNSLGSALVVLVKDSYSNPVLAGVTVGWSTTQGTLSASSSLTVSGGTASINLTNVGITSGSLTVTATAGGTQTFSETATAAAIVTTSSGTSQSAAVNSSLGSVLTALVTDASSNPVGAGVTVNWTLSTSGNSGTLSSASSTTNSGGLATISVTNVGHLAGAFTVTATSGSGSVNFSETANAGSPASIAVSSGSLQSASVNSSVTNPLVAVVQDSYGNAISSASVTWTISSSPTGGSLSGSSSSTNGSGQASINVTNIGTLAGSVTVTATSSGSTSFSLTASPGSPQNIIFVSGFSPPPTEVNNSVWPSFETQVTDQFGNLMTSGTGYTGAINLAVSGTCVLNGTTSASPSSGIATFSNIYITGATNANCTLNLSQTGTSATGSTVFLAAAGMNIQVPIELTDNGVQVSTSSPQTFDRTYTSFNTSDYDGTVTYALQVMASNSGSGSGTVSLINSSSIPVGSLAIPGSTSSATYFSGSITLSSSPSTLRLQLTGPSSGTLTVYSAKLLVTQVGASKTRIYIPLFQSIGVASNPSALGSAAAVDTYSGTSPGQGPTSYWNTYWIKPSAGTYSTLDSTTPWQFEAVLASAGGASVSAGLYTPFSQYIGGQSTSATTPTLVQSAPIADNTSLFTSGSSFFAEVTTSASETAYLYRAGLWIKLTGLTSAQVLYRMQTGQDLISMSGTNFSNPTYSHIDVGWNTGTPYVSDCGNTANSTFSACAGEIFGSSQNLNSESTGAYPLSGTFPITDGDFLGATSGGFSEITSYFVVNTHNP